VKTIRNLKK